MDVDPIQAYFMMSNLIPSTFNKLSNRQSPIDASDGQPVGFGYVDLIGRNDTAPTWNVLDNDRRFSGDIFGKVFCQEPCHAVVAPAGCKSNNQVDPLPFEVWCCLESFGLDKP